MGLRIGARSGIRWLFGRLLDPAACDEARERTPLVLCDLDEDGGGPGGGPGNGIPGFQLPGFEDEGDIDPS